MKGLFHLAGHGAQLYAGGRLMTIKTQPIEDNDSPVSVIASYTEHLR